jgi:hypothetical protein
MNINSWKEKINCLRFFPSGFACVDFSGSDLLHHNRLGDGACGKGGGMDCIPQTRLFLRRIPYLSC